MKCFFIILCIGGIIFSSYAESAGTLIDDVYYRSKYYGTVRKLGIGGVKENVKSATFRQYIYQKDVNRRAPFTYVFANACENCYTLKSVNVLSPLEVIEKMAFQNCTGLDSIYLPPPGSYQEELYLKIIEGNAFKNCWSLKYINLPVKLQTIERSAFLDCWSLPKIDIPYTVEAIGETAFKNCRSLKSIVLSTSVSNMGQAVFQNCTALETVGFYNKTMLSIKPLTFDNCTSLREVDIAYNTILYIDSAAFRNCSSLPKITLPASIDERSIGVSAFEGCTALDSVTALMEEPHPFGQDAFKDISPTCVLTVPYGKKAAYIAAGWTEEVFRGGVRELPPPAGIRPVKVNAADAACYDLQGRPVEHPQKGMIYIRQGRKIVCP